MTISAGCDSETEGGDKIDQNARPEDSAAAISPQ
jgi:hypothetical protein